LTIISETRYPADIKLKAPSENMQYGFDSLRYPALRGQYTENTVHGKTYVLPYKAVATGAIDVIDARLPRTGGFDAAALSFKINEVPVMAMPATRNNSRTVSVTPLMRGDEQVLEAVYTLTDTAGKKVSETLGALNVVAYDEQNIKLIIVPVGTSGNYIQGSINDQINKIYSQSVTQWDIVWMQPFENTTWDINGDEVFDDTDADDRMDYAPEMKALIKSYKDAQPADLEKQAVYVFLISGSHMSDLKGYMPFNKQFAFVFTKDMNDAGAIAHNISHEIAHGTFNLRHTFSPENTWFQSQNTTDNLMDYSTPQANNLNKYQWDLIHNPASVLFSWLESEGEGEIIVDRFKFTYDVYQKLSETERTNEMFVVDNSGAIKLFSDALTREINTKLKTVNDAGQHIFVIVDLFTYTEASDVDLVKSQVDKQIQVLKESNSNAIIIAAIGYKLVDRNNVPLQEQADLLIRSEFFTNSVQGTENFEKWRTISETNEIQVQSFVNDLIAALPQNPVFNSENCLELSYSDLGIQMAKEINPNDVKEWVSSFAGDNGVTIDYSYTGYPIVNSIEIPTASLNQPENSNADINIAIHFDDNGKKIIICHQFKAGAIVIPSVTASGESIQPTTIDEIVGLSKVFAAKALANAKAGGEKLQALFNSSVKGVVAAKTWTKTICDKMEIPQTCWNDIDHKQAYDRNPYKIEPVTSGVIDGTFEEIKSIPDLITLALDVAFDKEVRTSLWESIKSISWEDIKNFPVKVVKDKVTIYSKGGSIAKHEGGKDAVALASLFFGFGSAEKAKDLAETVGKNGTDYAKALQKAYDKIDISQIDEFGVKLDNLGSGITGVKLKKIGNTNHTTIAKIDVNGNLLFTESEHVYDAIYETEKKTGGKAYCVLEKANDGKTAFKEISEDVAKISHLLKTEPNKAFFYSGHTNGIGGELKALEIAKIKGGTTLEGVLADKGINFPKFEDNPKWWVDASAQYAKQVSGEVRAVIGKTLREDNIWENIELKRLKANLNVTKITTIDPETLIETVIFTR
jgi:hypothetical protein